MAKRDDDLVKFNVEALFEAAKFLDLALHERYNSPVFSTCHNGVGYNWRFVIRKWMNPQYYLFCLEFLGGALSSSVYGDCVVHESSKFEHLLNITFSMQSVKVHNRSCNNQVFRNGNINFPQWYNSVEGALIAHMCVFDGSAVSGFLKVVAEIKIKVEFFNSNEIMHKMKEEITEDQENITAVPSFFFDSIDAEPAFGLPLQLVVGTEKKVFFCLHQILEQNSAYFANLLHASPEFKGNKDSKINLPELSPQGVRAALCYLYTKKLPENFKEVAQVCLPAAHLFLLPGLVLECEKVLIGELSAENDFDMVIVAETYNLKLLKNMAMNSLLLRYDDLMENEDIVEKLKSVDLFGQLVKLVAMRVRCVAGHIL